MINIIKSMEALSGMRKKKVFAKLIFVAVLMMIAISGFATDAFATNTTYTITSGTDPGSPVSVTTGTTNTFVNQWVSTSDCATDPNSITIASTDASSVVSGVLIKTGSCAGATVSTCTGGPGTWTCAYAATYGANTYYVCANAHASNTGSTSGTSLAVTAVAGDDCTKALANTDTSPVFTVTAPPINLTIGQGTDLTANSTVCPDSTTYTEMDAFTLQLASAGTRAIDSVTVLLADAGDQNGINAVKIVLGTGSCADAGYGTATGPFGSTTIPITTTGLDATNTNTAYKVCVQPKAQAGPAGASYAVNGTVSTVTGSGLGTITDNDTASDTVNVDDLSYTAVTGFSGTAGNAKIDLTWTNGSSLTTLITNSTTGTFTDPTEGTSYSVGGFIGANKVVYKSTGAAATDSPLAVGVDMWYRAYFVDACNNYSTPASAGPYTPTAAPQDTVTLADGASNAPATVNVGQTDVKMLTFSLTSNSNADGQMTLTALKIDRTGAGSVDADVSAVKAYWSADATCTTGDTLLGSGTFAASTKTFSGLTQTINTTKSYICVFYSISGTANTGVTVGASIADQASVTVSEGKNAWAGIDSTNSNIQAAPACDDTVASCTDCHLMPPSDGTRDLFGNVVGSHEKSAHVAGTSNTDCVDCHGTLVTGYNHRNANVNMAAAINGGTYSKGASFAHTKTPTLGKCSNTNCHGTASPTWGASGVLNCGSCHPARTGGADMNLDGKHRMHYNSTTVPTISTYTNQSITNNYRINCGVCHDTAGQNKKHVDNLTQATGYRVDVIFNLTSWSTTWGGTYSTGSTTTTAPAPSAGSGYVYYTDRTCQNVYCHSTVQAAGGSGAPTYATPNWANASVLGCTGCHANPPATGAHSTHVTSMGYACTKCHKSDAGLGRAPKHANGIIDMQLINGASAVYGQGDNAPRGGYSGCTNVYCHGAFNGANGTLNTPSWGNASHGDCGTCHGATAAQTPSRASHPRHAGSGSTQTNVPCADCHGGNPGAIGHENVRVSWNINSATTGRIKRLAGDANPTYKAAASGSTTTAAPSASYGVCANIYCHSNAQVDGGGSGALTFATAPTWGGAAVTCGGVAANCHGNTNTSLTTGAHDTHLAAPYSYVCNNCHNNAGDETTKHANKLIEFSFLGANAVVGAYSEGATTAPGSGGYGKCSFTACHGESSPLWSAVNTGNACVTCHGVWGTVSPTETQIAPGNGGLDTGQDTSAADMNVGAHYIHLGGGTMSNTTGFRCEACHTKPSTVGQAGHIDSRLPAELIFNALANGTAQAPAPTYAPATGTCNNTYCHANMRATWIANTATQNPVWNNTGLLTGANLKRDCTMCHLMRYTGTLNHKGDANCSSCHDHLNDDDVSFSGVANRAKHLDGTVQASGGCSGCHGSVVGSAPDQFRNVAADFAVSSRHVFGGTVSDFDCIVCHAEGSTASSGTSITTTGQHNDAGKTIAMRNLDNPGDPGTAGTNFWQWPKPSATPSNADHTNMDNFCMSCHDADGSKVGVNSTDDGLLTAETGGSLFALRPFNSSDALDAAAASTGSGSPGKTLSDSATYGTKIAGLLDTQAECESKGFTWAASACTDKRSRVVDVDTQFNTANPSHHAVKGARYTTNNADWSSASSTAWATRTLKNGTALTTVWEKATLHCADCHTVDANAHSGSNIYMLSAATIDDTCWLCHSSGIYSATGGVGTNKSRFDHADDSSRTMDPTKGSTLDPSGSRCLLCHGGNPIFGYGAIHGMTATPDDPRNTTMTTNHRFIGGSYMSPGTADGLWTTAGQTISCYFDTAKVQAWTTCGQHNTVQGSVNSGYARGI